MLNDMKTLKLTIFGLLVAMFASSCYKEDELGSVDNIQGLGGDTWVQGPIDKWIYDSLTVPFNITAKYKWDHGELQSDFDRTLTPSKEEQVLPVMSSIKKVWINAYVAEAGTLFLRPLVLNFLYWSAVRHISVGRLN